MFVPERFKSVLLAGVLWAGISDASAQSMGDIFTLFGGIVREGMVQASRQAWAGLPRAELACLQQAVQQQGTTLQLLTQSGIGPNDGRIAALRAKCSPAGYSAGTTGPTSPYIVDGLRLGESVSSGSAEYASYVCSPSQQFPEFTWCQRRKKEQGPRGAFQSVNSMLHQQTGTTAYISRYIEPAYFGNKEMQAEIQRLSGRFGKPGKVMVPPQLAGMKEAVIAVWGDVELVPLDQESISTLAAGRSVTKGLLFDFLGDFERSAKAGLPVYRLAGGPGYLWSASAKENGQGHLRITAIDVLRLNGKPAAPTVFAEQPSTTQLPLAPEPFAPPAFNRDGIRGQPGNQAWPGANGFPGPRAGAGAGEVPTRRQPSVFAAEPNSGVEAQLKPSAEASAGVRIVEVVGRGATPDLARKDAARAAVQQVAGLFIDNRRRLELHYSDQKTSEVVEDKILSYTNAYVSRMEVLAENKAEEYEVTARVAVVVKPLLKTLQENAIPTVPFDQDSAAATVETMAEEKTNALGIVTDLLDRVGNVVQLGVGKPEIAAGVPSFADSAWIQVPVSYFVNQDALREWRTKFDLLAAQRQRLEIPMSRPASSMDNSCSPPRFADRLPTPNHYTSRSFLQENPGAGQTGFAVCFAAERTNNGYVAECLGRTFVLNQNERDCRSGPQGCLSLKARAAKIALKLEFVDQTSEILYAAHVPFANFPSIAVQDSRTIPQNRDRVFFNYCVGQQDPMFAAATGRGTPAFGELLVFPPKSSRLDAFAYVLLPNEIIPRIKSVRARITAGEQ